jgi:hypothetical protein
VVALVFQESNSVDPPEQTATIPIQFHVKTGRQTDVFHRANSPEKESGGKSPHSKGQMCCGVSSVNSKTTKTGVVRTVAVSGSASAGSDLFSVGAEGSGALRTGSF